MTTGQRAEALRLAKEAGIYANDTLPMQIDCERLVRLIALARMPHRAAPQEPVAWMIECSNGFTGWWDGRIISGKIDCRFFDTDPNACVRLPSRAAALHLIGCFGNSCMKATEHSWFAAPQPQASPQEPAELIKIRSQLEAEWVAVRQMQTAQAAPQEPQRYRVIRARNQKDWAYVLGSEYPTEGFTTFEAAAEAGKAAVMKAAPQPQAPVARLANAVRELLAESEEYEMDDGLMRAAPLDNWHHVQDVLDSSGPQSIAPWHQLDILAAMKVTDDVMNAYKREWPKWWKRMDGTPILNDMPVRMAQAFVDLEAAKLAVSHPAAAQSQAAAMAALLDEARKHIMDWWHSNGGLSPAYSPELVECIDAALAAWKGRGKDLP